MIAPWMISTLLVGGLVSLAALAAERALLMLGIPVRWVWTAALGLSLLVPCLGHFLPRSVDMTWPYASEPYIANLEGTPCAT